MRKCESEQRAAREGGGGQSKHSSLSLSLSLARSLSLSHIHSLTQTDCPSGCASRSSASSVLSGDEDNPFNEARERQQVTSPSIGDNRLRVFLPETTGYEPFDRTVRSTRPIYASQLSREGGVEVSVSRCRANLARVRQSRSDSVLGFQVKILQTLLRCSLFARKRRDQRLLQAESCCVARCAQRGSGLGIHPRVKSLRSSYTGLCPDTTPCPWIQMLSLTSAVGRRRPRPSPP